MMRIIPRSPDAYLFRDGNHRSVGWLEARTIRFTRFVSHSDAVAGAVQGGLALAAYTGGTTLCAAHVGPQAARPPDGMHGLPAGRAGRSGIRVVDDGRYQWVFIDARRVARLVPPADVEAVPSVEEALACGGSAPCARTSEASAFSLEFLLAESVSLDARFTIAQVLYAAVHHHQGRVAPARGVSRTPRPARRRVQPG